MQLSDFVAQGDIGRSTADRVCEILRQAIIGRVLEPGERLVEAKIAQELRVSITPVRQAFSNLANQGLLTVFPYKGTYVTIITQEFINDLAFVREHVELLAIERAFDNIVPDDAKQLNNLCKLSDYHFQNDDLYQAIHYDLQFHEFFISKAQSPLLIEMWKLIKQRIEYSQTYTKYGDRPENYMQLRHGKIISAVETYDKAALRSAMLDHMETTIRLVNFPKEKDIQYK
ncbi:MAG: GntR family transcriptional regulator [Oscillospiraceae bacterium]